MARFPEREAEIKALAQNIITGLTDAAATFPAPPVANVLDFGTSLRRGPQACFAF